MDWGMVGVIAASLSAAAAIHAAVGRVLDRVFGSGKEAGTTSAEIATVGHVAAEARGEIKEIRDTFQKHEVKDAEAFARIDASIAALARDQVNSHGNIAQMIGSVREDVRAAARERVAMIGELRDEVRSAMGELRHEARGINDRIDGVIAAPATPSSRRRRVRATA
jgi:hypothetical protein